MSDGSNDADGGGGTPFANSPVYDPSSPAGSPGGGGNTPVPKNDDDDDARDAAADVNTIWEAVQDDEGRTYYYNTVSGESSWEAPPGFASSGGEQGEGSALGDDASAEGSAAAAAAATTEGADPDQPQRWTGYKDDEGRTYYYNETTGETQWERPAEGPGVVVVEEEDMEAEAEAEVDAEQRQRQEQEGSEPMEEEGEYGAEGEDGVVIGGERAAMDVEPVPEEEVKDPKKVALERAEAALAKTDAVMELGKSYPCMYLCT
jgi:hypothetical protein